MLAQVGQPAATFPEVPETDSAAAVLQHYVKNVNREKVEPCHPYEVSPTLTRKPKGITMKKYLVSAAIAAFVFTAQTAVAAEFYVVRDATTKKCTIVDTKPTTTTTTIVDNGTYKTKTEADSGMKTTKVSTE